MPRTNLLVTAKPAILVLAGLISGQTALAGGLYISEEVSASNIAYGGISFAARQNDAGVAFSNPAGMTSFDSSELFVGGSLMYLHGQFSRGDDNTISGPSGNVNEILPLANADYVRPINDRWYFGLHAGNYFGLALNWGGDWVGRYVTTQAIVVAPQIQPTLAYKINDSWSVGAGLGFTLAYLKDKKKIDGPIPGVGRLRYTDTDFAVQPNLGVMYEPSVNTRIGLRYLVETDLDFRDDPSVDTDFGGAIDSNRSLSIGMTMPQQAMIGLWQRVGDNWALLGNLGWEDWSEFGQIALELSGTSIDDTFDIQTEDTWHVGIGGEYEKSDRLTYTMGLSWDSSWQRDRNRTAIIPIGSVWRMGGGFNYRRSEDFSWGAGLSFFYQGDLPVKTKDSPSGRFSGEYSNVALYWLSFYGQWR